MDSLQAFAEAVTQLEQIKARMSGSAASGETDEKRGSIEARRQFSAKTADIVKAAEACPAIAGRPEAIGALRDALNKMRSVAADHQARFPSVSADANDPAYAQSARNVWSNITAFVDCARRILADARRHQGTN